MTEPGSNNKETHSQIHHVNSTKMKREQQQKKQREAQRKKNGSVLMKSGYTDEIDQDGCEDDEYDDADILTGEKASKEIGEDVCEVRGKRKATPRC